jgi:DNA-binding NarL/FixJ family response regulator
MKPPPASHLDHLAGRPQLDGKPASVLLVDDHPLLRDGLKALLARDPGLSVAGEAATLAEARRLAAVLKPDLVLLDFDLPDGDSLALVEELRAIPDGPRVVVLCGRDDPSGADSIAIRLGASGFVSKRTDGDEVLKVVRDALGGRTYLSPEMIEKLLKRRPRPGGVSA